MFDPRVIPHQTNLIQNSQVILRNYQHFFHSKN